MAAGQGETIATRAPRAHVLLLSRGWEGWDVIVLSEPRSLSFNRRLDATLVVELAGTSNLQDGSPPLSVGPTPTDFNLDDEAGAAAIAPASGNERGGRGMAPAAPDADGH